MALVLAQVLAFSGNGSASIIVSADIQVSASVQQRQSCSWAKRESSALVVIIIGNTHTPHSFKVDPQKVGLVESRSDATTANSLGKVVLVESRSR